MGKFLTKAGGPLFDPVGQKINPGKTPGDLLVKSQTMPGGPLYTGKGGPLYTGKGGPLYDPARDAILAKDGSGGGNGGYVGTPPPIAPSPGGIGYGTPGWTPQANSGVPTGQQQSIPLTPQGQPMSGSPSPSMGASAPMMTPGQGGSMAAMMGGLPPGLTGMNPGMIAAAMSILGQNMGSNRPQDQI